jgi:hypothetical protein
MCFGLLIAVGSFVTQGAEALPPAFRGPEVLFSSMALVVVVMLYWLARVLTKGWSAPAEVQVTRSKTMALALVTALFLTGADTPSFFDRLQGRWEGTGAAFGGPSKIDAEWQWALGGKFFRLDLRYEIRNADGSTGEFAGHAYYARKGPNTFEGQWFDSQGNQYPITATLAGDVLTAHWGIPGKVEGRSIYGLSTGGRVFEINDAMRRKDGTWRDFAAFKLQRAPSDGKTQG